MDFKDVRSKSSIIHVHPFNSEKKREGVALQVVSFFCCTEIVGDGNNLLLNKK